MQPPRARLKKRGQLGQWLERRFATPEFAGGMLLGLSAFFFLAATNTLAGWLYVISGVSFALMAVSFVMPRRLLQDVAVERSPLGEVGAREDLVVEVVIHNPTKTPRYLLELRDLLPPDLSLVTQQDLVLDAIAPGERFYWQYTLATLRRGVFLLPSIEIATSSPLGLFRSRRTVPCPQKAVVYPQILPLSQCPLLDQVGDDDVKQHYNFEHHYDAANEGLTKTLRPYRWGDSIRLVHWRTSARYGELRVRELEVTISGQEVVIALDTSAGWAAALFEEAVTAAASLYFYALKSQRTVQFWTPESGIIQRDRQVLEALAEAAIAPESLALKLPQTPVLLLTHRPESLAHLPAGSRWILWQEQSQGLPRSDIPGVTITGAEPDLVTFRGLLNQLQGRGDS
jgi:uncharacterized protein (DUF58 family)